MLPPYAVRLLPHDPQWAEQADREATRILEAIWPAIIEMHHVGSTSIPGISAKPIEQRDANRIYKVTEIVDGHQVVRYTDKRPATGTYTVLGR
jgi:GrpB-like predicted nucleotidyltransferase (UPF0157 family)